MNLVMYILLILMSPIQHIIITQMFLQTIQIQVTAHGLRMHWAAII